MKNLDRFKTRLPPPTFNNQLKLSRLQLLYYIFESSYKLTSGNSSMCVVYAARESCIGTTANASTPDTLIPVKQDWLKIAATKFLLVQYLKFS